MQGFVAGLLGMVKFGVVVTRLGPSATALSGAVVPAVTAIGGWLFLDELMDGPTFFGIAIMVAGLIAFALGRVKPRPEQPIHPTNL